MLFWGDMGNSRRYIRVLRHLGIALIFAPEPFTTPFGVACILAARRLSRQHEAKLNSRLRATVQYYLARTSPSGSLISGASCDPSRSRRPCLSEQRPILGQITGSGGLGADSPARKGRQGIQENRVNHSTTAQNRTPSHKHNVGFFDTSTGTQKVIHHTIDMEWLSRRYEVASIAVAHSDWITTSSDMESAAHHSLDVGLLSRHYGTGSAGQAKATTNTVDMAQLRQRYGSAASHSTVHRALQSTNHYYKMSSRKNIVGGQRRQEQITHANRVGTLKNTHI